MKVYEIATGYTPIPARLPAATEIVVEGLTRALLRQGIPAEILDIRGDRADTDLPIREVAVPEWLTGTDASLGIRHKVRRVVYSVCLARELRKLLRECEEETVLHFHNQYNLFFFLLLVPRRLRRRALAVYTNHSGIWRLPWAEIRGTIHRRYFQEAVGMKKADAVFVLNEETRETVRCHLGVPEARITVIGNGVDTDIYRPLPPEEIKKIQKTLGLSGKTVLLQVGSVCENKGQIRTLETVAPLLRSGENRVYAYAGGIVSEAYHRELLDRARQLGLGDQVRYLGQVSPGEEMNRLYNMAAVTVLSSRYEGFPLVTAESLAAGVPVATPFSIGPGCTDTVEEALKHRTELSQAARDAALAHLTWDTVAADYAKKWEEALWRKNSTAR